MVRTVDIAENDRASITGILAEMPKFTEPVTLEDMKAYRDILRTRIIAGGMPKPPPIEIFRHKNEGPITLRVGTDIVRELLPVG